METPNLAEPGDTVLNVELLDEQGTTHAVRVAAADWEAALTLTHEWAIFDHHDRPVVASRALKASTHRARNYKMFWLTLADFIALPRYGETVRHLDGDTLNVTRANLVCRPKGARTVATPPKPLTRKEIELLDKLSAIFDRAKPDIAAPSVGEPDPAPAKKRKRTRRPGLKRGTPETSAPAPREAS